MHLCLIVGKKSVSKEKTEGIFTLFFSYGEGKITYTMLYRLTFKSSCNKIKCGDKKKIKAKM